MPQGEEPQSVYSSPNTIDLVSEQVRHESVQKLPMLLLLWLGLCKPLHLL